MSESQVCADASFLVKLVLPEDGSDRAKALWDEWGENAISVLAPTLILYEFTSSVNKYVQRKWLSPDRGHQALDFLLRLPLELVGGGALHLTAFTIATQAAMGSAYDAHYIAVARYLNCVLWTGDRRMYGTAVKLGIDTALISASNRHRP